MYSLVGQDPSNGSTLNPANTLVFFSIITDGFLDSSKLYVNIGTEPAIDSGSFTERYNGLNSEIVIDENLTSITIQRDNSFELGKNVSVTVKIIDDKTGTFSEAYSFKIIPKEPLLLFSNMTDGRVVESAEVVYFEFVDYIDGINPNSIIFKLNGKEIIKDGVIDSEFLNAGSKILAITDGYSITIDHPEFFRNGPYEAFYQVSDTSQNKLIGKINYSIDLKKVIYPDFFPQSNFVGFYKGLETVQNYGDGTTLIVTWRKLVSRIKKSEVFALIYHNPERLEVFDGLPKYIATKDAENAILTGFNTGDSIYFGVRSLEAFKGVLNLSGMNKINDDVYIFPTEIEIASTVLPDDLIINVTDTSGYPDSGLLLLGSSEVVKYETVDRANNRFLLAANGRGLNNTAKGVFVSGDDVRIFYKCQDSNYNVSVTTVAHVDGYQTDRKINNIGLVVTDYTDNDKKFFQGFDFCGYHQARPDLTLTGKDDCGTYLGGEFNKTRGFNIYDRMLNREEVLLDQVGEPSILLKRIWNGTTCECVDMRSVHPKIRSCNKCYGTGYVGGYQQYQNLRRIDKRVMIRFKEAVEDLNLGPHQHLNQTFEPSCWTLPQPAIRDRDIIIRFDFTNDLEYFYEVLDASREKLVYKHFGRQNLRLKRLDKTDIIYTFKYQ